MWNFLRQGALEGAKKESKKLIKKLFTCHACAEHLVY